MNRQRLGLRTQLVRFIVVGGLSAVVDFGLLTAMMALGMGHTPAKALSFVAGTTTAYLMNRRWTFQAGGSPNSCTAVLALFGTTFVVQVGLFALLFGWLQRTWGTTAAQVVGFVIAQAVATTVNFIVQRAVIFRHPA